MASRGGRLLLIDFCGAVLSAVRVRNVREQRRDGIRRHRRLARDVTNNSTTTRDGRRRQLFVHARNSRHAVFVEAEQLREELT